MKISSVITPILEFFAVLAIELIANLQLDWFKPSLALALLIFGVNAFYGNGTISNVLAATIVTVYGFWSSHFAPGRMWQVAIVVYVIAIANGYIKDKLRAENEAKVRAKIQLEKLQRDLEIAADIAGMDDLVQRQVKMLERARSEINVIIGSDFELPEWVRERLDRNIEIVANVMTVVAGWRALDKSVKNVRANYGQR